MKTKTRVGILGSGGVGKALAEGFITHDYEVMIGTRDPAKLKDWKEKTGLKVRTGSYSEAAAFGSIIIVAVKGTIAKGALYFAGAENFSDKTVIDVTNPIADTPPENGTLKFFTSLDRSLMEDLQAALPQAHFVKAFSCIGSAFMVNPNFGGVKPSMFICGNNTHAKEEVKEILVKFGFEPEDMGSVEAARAIEPLCILWCLPGLLRNQWAHAFKLLKR